MWTAGSLTLTPCPPDPSAPDPSATDPSATDPSVTDPGPSDSSHPDCAVAAVESAHEPWAQRPASVVFDAPWQAQIFALVVQLNERGVFSWPEWSATLGEALAQTPPLAIAARSSVDGIREFIQGSWMGDGGTRNGLPAPLDDAWAHWPVALERLLVRKGIAAPGVLVALRQAWQMADESTPHGQPVRLGSAVRRLSGGYAPDAVPASAAEPGPVRNP